MTVVQEEEPLGLFKKERLFIVYILQPLECVREQDLVSHRDINRNNKGIKCHPLLSEIMFDFEIADV